MTVDRIEDHGWDLPDAPVAAARVAVPSNPVAFTTVLPACYSNRYPT